MSLKVGGLFSGVGGIELAFKQAGFDIAWANDFDQYAHKTYKKILKADHYIAQTPLPIEQLISQEFNSSLTGVDILVAGFPCQAFSIAGYRKGFKDKRGNVFFNIIDILNHLKKHEELPSALLLENVKNFKGHDNGNTFLTVKNELENLGYSVYCKILNTSDYTTIPQNRERTFMICFKEEAKWSKYQFDEESTFISNEQFKNALADCPRTTTFHNNFLNTNVKRMPLKSIQDLLDENVDPEFFYTDLKYPKAYSLLKEAMTSFDTVYQYRRVYVRENKRGVCPTLTANMGTGGHNVPLVLINSGNKNCIRKLTPLECFRFQGYNNISLPKSLANSHLYKQAGNSVTVPLVKMLAENIKLSLES